MVLVFDGNPVLYYYLKKNSRFHYRYEAKNPLIMHSLKRWPFKGSLIKKMVLYGTMNT